jgi:predicted  nucleic acid-binding Zn-ribbon protein
MTVEQVPGAEDPFAVLLRVQDLDTSLAQLQHRRETLSERRELAEVGAKLAELDAEIAEAAARRDQLASRQRELEAQIGQINDRRAAIEERLYGARGTAARDLQAMDDELQHLTFRRAELEEDELVSMEAQDPIDTELARLQAARDELTVTAEELRQALTAVEAVLTAEISTTVFTRGVEAAKLPTWLSDRYEALRARLKGTGAARLVGNRCEGCHLELPSMEVDRIRHLAPDVVVTCDQCGRILVRAAPPT